MALGAGTDEGGGEGRKRKKGATIKENKKEQEKGAGIFFCVRTVPLPRDTLAGAEWDRRGRFLRHLWRFDMSPAHVVYVQATEEMETNNVSPYSFNGEEAKAASGAKHRQLPAIPK